MSEKPLHVRVAEALGREVVLRCGQYEAVIVPIYPNERWTTLDGAEAKPLFTQTIPRYDTDWSATGPLIERYGISIVVPDEFNPEGRGAIVAAFGGVHGWDDGSVCSDDDAAGETPLIAVCNLILALKAAGKLSEAA